MFNSAAQDIAKLKKQIQDKNDQLTIQQQMFNDLQKKYNDTKVKFKKIQMEWMKWQQENNEPMDKRDLHDRINYLSNQLKEEREEKFKLEERIKFLTNENTLLNNEIEMQRENVDKILRLEYEEKFRKHRENIMQEIELYKKENSRKLKKISEELDSERKKRLKAEKDLDAFWDDNKF